MEDFVDEHLQEESEIETYKKSKRWLSTQGFIAAYIASITFAFLVPKILNDTLNINVQFLSGDSFAISLVVLGVASYLSVGVAAGNKIRDLGFRNRHVVYHYIAKAIQVWKDDTEDPESIAFCLKEAVDYTKSKDVDFAHPVVQGGFIEYVELLSDIDGKESKNEFIEDTFEDILSQVTSSIHQSENTDWQIETEIINVESDNSSSWFKFVVKVLGEYLQDRELGKVAPAIVLVASIVVFFIASWKGMAAVLAGYPVIKGIVELVVGTGESEN